MGVIHRFIAVFLANHRGRQGVQTRHSALSCALREAKRGERRSDPRRRCSSSFHPAGSTQSSHLHSLFGWRRSDQHSCGLSAQSASMGESRNSGRAWTCTARLQLFRVDRGTFASLCVSYQVWSARRRTAAAPEPHSLLALASAEYAFGPSRSIRMGSLFPSSSPFQWPRSTFTQLSQQHL